jgi:hypothetical protein
MTPNINGVYVTDNIGDIKINLNEIKKPLKNRVYFSGSGLSYDNQSTVYGAFVTAKEASVEIIKNIRGYVEK